MHMTLPPNDALQPRRGVRLQLLRPMLAIAQPCFVRRLGCVALAQKRSERHCLLYVSREVRHERVLKSGAAHFDEWRHPS